MATTFDVENLTPLLEPLCEPYRIQMIVVFGSSVTGMRGPESDLDLAFLGDAPLDLVAVTTNVIRLLHTDRVDVVDLRRASPLLAMEWRATVVRSMSGSPARMSSSSRWRSAAMSIQKSCGMLERTPSIAIWLPKASHDAG